MRFGGSVALPPILSHWRSEHGAQAVLTEATTTENPEHKQDESLPLDAEV